MHRLLVHGTLDELDRAWRAGCHVDAVDERGRRALYFAAAAGRTAVVDWLLTHGADPGVLNAEDGRTALHAACAGGHCDVIARLLAARDGLDMTVRDRFGLTAAELAAAGNHLDVVRLLLGSNSGWLDQPAHVRSPVSTPSRTPLQTGGTPRHSTRGSPLTSPHYTPRTRMRTPHRT